MRVDRFVRLAVLMVALAAFVGCASTDVRRSSGEYVDDKVISAKVNTDLATDPITKAYQIDITTYKGVVQLSGFVDSKAAVSRAEEIAKNVNGVQSVKNNLIVR